MVSRRLGTRCSAGLQACPTAGLKARTTPVQRRQLRRPRAVAHGAANRNVVELHAFARLPQQQAAAAHVAAPDEVDREPEAVAEDREQEVDIHGRSEAAETQLLTVQ